MPALLLIDAGNSRVKWAEARGRTIRVRGERATGAFDPRHLRRLAGEFPGHQVVLACVVPRLVPAFQRACGKRLYIVRGGAKEIGLTYKYPRPRELGADRIASAVAAGAWNEEQGRAVIAVNCGTATAFTVVDDGGAVCGGAIAPGLRAQLDSLLGATAQLPDLRLSPTRSVLARNTREAIRAGVITSYCAGVREIVAALREIVGRDAAVLFTGGDARLAMRDIPAPVELRPLLVFEGLRIMGQRVFPA
jgi:type III pantothenate kinase